MVERLKVAVAKARAERARLAAANPAAPKPEATRPIAKPTGGIGLTPSESAEPPRLSVDDAWASLEKVELDQRHLERNRIVTLTRTDPAHAAFDMLRTRILGAFSRHGWTRVGITSPTKGCGKTFVAANLALSLARQKDSRTVLLDLDLRAPGLVKALGADDFDPIKWFLSGEASAVNYLRRVGDNLALGLGAGKTSSPAETLLAPAAGKALSDMRAALEPDVVIYDLPPMLSCDDVLGFLPQLDCVLLVVGGEITRPAEVTECELLLAEHTQLLGVLLNKGEDAETKRYDY
ncbi:MAG: CpsD/CapB family tyrosine-protein kinase [Pseudomonadota bacterium]